jgi:hypothetical protein
MDCSLLRALFDSSDDSAEVTGPCNVVGGSVHGETLWDDAGMALEMKLDSAEPADALEEPDRLTVTCPGGRAKIRRTRVNNSRILAVANCR